MRALAPHALLARQAVESGGFTVGAGEAMSKHWSGVEMGHYFEVVINDYDPNIHTESSVTVPFYRSEPAGLSTCMLEAVEFTVKSVAADSDSLPNVIRRVCGDGLCLELHPFHHAC